LPGLVVAAEEERERYIWLAGPAKLRVAKGVVDVNAAAFSEGSVVVVHRDRSYTLILGRGSVVEVETPAEPQVRDASPEEVELLLKWRELAEAIAREGPRLRIAVVGSVDVGKSTFTTLLANTLLKHGAKPFIVDADLGQANIGIPGFVTGSLFERPLLWHRQLEPEVAYFVGSISPCGFEGNVVAGILAILSTAREKYGDAPVVVDTDGWFRGPGALAYKISLLSAIKPTHVVHVLEEGESSVYGDKIKALCEALGAKYARVEAPPVRKKRDKAERALLRGEKLIAEGRQRTFLCLREVPVVGALKLGLGSPLRREELEELSQQLGVPVLYGELQEEQVVVVAKGRPKQAPKGVRVLDVQALKGLILGLANESGLHLGWGVVVGFDESREALVLETAYKGRVAYAVSGVIKFDGAKVYAEKLL